MRHGAWSFICYNYLEPKGSNYIKDDVRDLAGAFDCNAVSKAAAQSAVPKGTVTPAGFEAAVRRLLIDCLERWPVHGE